MVSKKIVLGAASACAALFALTATAASADPRWGYGYDGGRYGWQDRDMRYGGGSADGLLQREDRMAGWIRRMSYEGRLDRDESQRAWRMLGDARAQTAQEAREHGRYLPGHDYRDIDQRLDSLENYLRHEAHEDDDD